MIFSACGAVGSENSLRMQDEFGVISGSGMDLPVVCRPAGRSTLSLWPFRQARTRPPSKRHKTKPRITRITRIHNRVALNPCGMRSVAWLGPRRHTPPSECRLNEVHQQHQWDSTCNSKVSGHRDKVTRCERREPIGLRPYPRNPRNRWSIITPATYTSMDAAYKQT